MREISRRGLPEALLAGHGGNLFAARSAYPQAPEPWLDLSTGISPHAYPFAGLPGESWTRLPQPEELRTLEAAAAMAYRVPPVAEVIAAPGSQAVIGWLPYLFLAKRAGILGFTYHEHARRWERAGARVTIARELPELASQDAAVVVNPNNPDGRLVPAAALHRLGRALAARGGLLIIDEAFIDFLEPAASAIPDMPARGVVVLRSFGKAYGLPGLRLGFAIGPRDLMAKLRAALGPWPVSCSAIAIGSKALMDAAWLAAVRLQLAAQGTALDRLLTAAGFDLIGGSMLFRLAQHLDAQIWFERLAEAGILVRRFEARPQWLRFGIPGTDADLTRLAHALGLETNNQAASGLKPF